MHCTDCFISAFAAGSDITVLLDIRIWAVVKRHFGPLAVVQVNCL